MKNIAKTGLIVGAFLFGMASCNQQGGAVEEAQETNEEMAEDTAVEDETEELSEFMTKAASGGMMEVELGKTAQQQAQNQQVKDFGSMMVTDHTKANDELKALASKKNIVLPDSMGEAHMDHVEELRGKKGADFDKAYMDLMVSDHEEDVNLFEEASNNLQDAEVKAFAAKTLPILQKHLKQAQAIDSTMAAME
jgi:putative membrane protein